MISFDSFLQEVIPTTISRASEINSFVFICIVFVYS